MKSYQPYAPTPREMSEAARNTVLHTAPVNNDALQIAADHILFLEQRYLGLVHVLSEASHTVPDGYAELMRAYPALYAELEAYVNEKRRRELEWLTHPGPVRLEFTPYFGNRVTDEPSQMLQRMIDAQGKVLREDWITVEQYKELIHAVGQGAVQQG